ncbi:hypothetical protein ACVV4I_25880 [Escherichia coli]
MIYDPHSHGLIHSLCWQDVPLIRFWSEAGCPTCAEFVYSGFAEDEQGAARFLSALENWNCPWSGLVSPDSYLCVLLDGHHKATAAALEGRPLKTLVLSTATHFNDEQQTLVFPGGNVCTKQSCNTTYQNSPRAKHYRPAHGRVSALISTSAHPKPGQAPHLPVDGAKPNAASRCFFLDFAINDDGERPELTKIMDDYFRKP